LKHYGRDERVSALMIEIRRDVYMKEPGGAAHAGLGTLARSLAELVDAVVDI
jgi:N-formylglutamate amidohydrolase